MKATMCPRCGSLADRCECAELRREGMLLAAGCCDEQAAILRDPFMHSLPAMPGPVICKDRARQFEEAANRIRALARKPEPL
jgi:hypothetical protein